jgi:hypothetical protein
VCDSCGYRRKAYTYSIENKKAVCKICSIEIVRGCKECGKEFPAGFGRVCSDCNFKKSIDKKTKFISDSLSKYMSRYFIEFSRWLQKRRGLSFTSNHIQHYHKYFFELDKLCEELERMPTYEEVVDRFSVATTRKYLSVTLFFSEIGLLKVNNAIKEECANLDMIDKYLKTFNENSYRDKILNAYYNSLITKLKDNKTTIRSIRLALTPAVKLLQYCEHFNTEKPDVNILSGYLWLYPGQRAAVTGFVNFLRSKFKYDISLKEVQKVVLERPKTSKKILKQRFIDLLRKNQKVRDNQDLIKTAIEYLHGIEIPNNVFINISEIKIDVDKTKYLNIASFKFYLFGDIPLS